MLSNKFVNFVKDEALISNYFESLLFPMDLRIGAEASERVSGQVSSGTKQDMVSL
jgi:hypothetical protein